MAGKKQIDSSGGNSAINKNKDVRSSGSSKNLKVQVQQAGTINTTNQILNSLESPKLNSVPKFTQKNGKLPNEHTDSIQFPISNPKTLQPLHSIQMQKMSSNQPQFDLEQCLSPSSDPIIQSKNLTELSPEERKKIRQFRFTNSDSNDTAQILKEMEHQKNLKIERAARFGIETTDVQNMKKNIRLERFKGENGGVIDIDEKEKRALRLARFGPDQSLTSGDKSKRTNLEFSLDEYKLKNKKEFQKKFNIKGKKSVNRDKNKFNRNNKFKPKISNQMKKHVKGGKTLNVKTKFNKNYQSFKNKK